MSSLFLCWIFYGLLVQVDSWGAVGHRIVARLAQTQLTDKASEWARELVPWHWNGNLSAMAVWGDDILYPDSNPSGFDNWQWSRPLHFINTPDWSCNYRVERDCPNDICVHGAIKNYTKRLESELDDIQHQEALYFLLHFVGDIHQPLHVGFKSDYGGNQVRGKLIISSKKKKERNFFISGRFMNVSGQTNLHSIWDTGIINYRIRTDFYSDWNLYYEYIYQIMIRQTVPTNDNDIEQWIQESLDIVCGHAYFDDQNEKMNSSIRFHLKDKYYQSNYKLIEQRLAQGGRRLGALLNQLAENPRKTLTHHSLCLSTYILIAILSAEFILGICLAIYFFIRFKTKH